MASRSDSAGSLRPRSRRSIAHVPRSRMTAGVDKENTTSDIGAIQPLEGQAKPKDKKSRSKSLGPGGLDALQKSNGNRRKSTVAALPLKSILKPTVPVSPVRKIPTFEETRRRTPARNAQQDGGNDAGSDQGKEGLLIDFDTPGRPNVSGNDDTANPFDTFNAQSAIRDGQALEKEKKERERKRILEQREARRKSMANRRVSFAPEATLHTWNVVEIPDDSTSSSASNSTRRASALAAQENQQPAHAHEQTDPPSSPDAGEESDITFSPVKHQDLQQLRNRSTSDDNVGSSQETFSSPFSGSSVDGSEDAGFEGLAEEDDGSSDSETNFDGESTAMSMDDMTVQSGATAQTDGSESTTSSARLNNALRQAANEAGTNSNDFDDDNGEMSMEIADTEITGAFQPWIKKGQRQSFDWGDIDTRHDQENMDLLKSSGGDEADDDAADEELSMDVTNAIGGILSKQPERRQSVASRRSIGQDTNYDDQTMEFTNVVGGSIAQPSPAKSTAAESDANEDEEMTMEFTNVIGGVLSKDSQPQPADENDYDQVESHTPASISKQRNFSEWEEDDDAEGMDMEMTGAVGGILPPIEERTEPQDDDQTAGMDFTEAMGQIMPSEVGEEQGQAKRIMELETDHGQITSSPFQEDAIQSPAKSPAKSPSKSPAFFAAVASENGSPSLASVRSRSRRSSSNQRRSTTPSQNPQPSSPLKKALTPPKQLTPQADRPTTPGKTPPSSNVSFRGASPKKLFEPELKKAAGNQKSPRKSLFGNNASTGESTPMFVFRPNEKRRSSGLGIDKEGLGSPRVAAMLDTRRSIGEEIPQFVPQDQPKQGVRFEDPLKLQEEVDREREEEEYREDGHIPPPDLSERDVTSNLKDMISSLTPKKNKPRKSLHVGAARGILGKRPVELDLDDDEAEFDNTPKRLKGREASPVKNVRLPAPQTVEDTLRRSTAKSPARSKPFVSSPLKVSTTPTQEPNRLSTGVTPLRDGMGALDLASESERPEESENVDAENQEPEFPPIQLQEFLNMTNIHFMELTTTKRRHTTAPGSATKRSVRLSSESKPATFEDCVTAGLCTIPMLELYQHSCRELKSYISEGRQVIRSIETETFADNPPLFREYATAAPDIRLLMDNQFRNVKTHARYLSKATWYEWRMKLLEGLKEGLDRHQEEIRADDDLLSKREAVLNSVVPTIVERHAALAEQATSLQQLADEMENCDQDELRGAREKLSTVEDEIALKKQQLQEMQAEIQENTSAIEQGTELKTEFMAQIQEAEKVKAECRGWSAKEISELKESVSKIERQTGWAILSAKPSGASAGPLLEMSYRDQLQLMLHPAAFNINSVKVPDAETDQKMNMPLEVRYKPGKGKKPAQLSAIASLVLKSLQKHIATLEQSKVAPKHLLRFISEAWDLVLNLEEEARMLEFCGVTKLKLSEVDDKASLRARCTLLGNASIPSSKIPTAKRSKKIQNPGSRRIDVDFALKTRIVQGDSDNSADIGVMDFETEVIASKVYGFGSGNEAGISENEMRDILANGIGDKTSAVQLGNGVWSKAVQALTGVVF